MNLALKKIEMFLEGELLEAEFVDRPNRFLTRVKYDNRVVESHLPDPGRLKELLIPGASLLIKKEGNPNRKTKFSTQAVYLDGQLISLNSWLPNQFVDFLLKRKSIEFLELKYVSSNSVLRFPAPLPIPETVTSTIEHPASNAFNEFINTSSRLLWP